MGKLIQEYYNWTYSPQMIKTLKDTNLTESDMIKIKEADEKVNRELHYLSLYKPLLIPIYKMRFRLNLTCTEMANLYNVNIRTLERWLTKYGWKFTRVEAQQLAASKSRDYAAIKITRKKTALNRMMETEIFGSKIEDYARYKLNLDLTEKLKECQVIVGVNNISIIPMEIDIPIIIFSNNNLYKYAVEVNGDYNHKRKALSKREIKKSELLKESSFKLIRIYTKSYANKEGKIIYKELENKLLILEDMIIQEILNDVDLDNIINL